MSTKNKPQDLDAFIRQLLGEGFLVPLYFTQGIFALKEKIAPMTDEELYAAFDGLFAPRKVRADVNYLFNSLVDFIQKNNHA